MDTTSTSIPPVLIIIFNRPDKVRRLIASLESVRPAEIYIAADGPRKHVPTDSVRCTEARALVAKFPWPCTVHTLFQEENLGCKRGVATGISWFFSHVPEGIILEDDCIPTSSFFSYCTQLLEKYRNTEQVMHIAGSTFLAPEKLSYTKDSYFFSHLSLIWGWATWKRAWQHYDIAMNNLEILPQKLQQERIFARRIYTRFWLDLFHHVRSRNIDTWDAQWLYSILHAGGVCIIPKYNLIHNVGFDADATHTKNSPPPLPAVHDFTEPLVHPQEISVDTCAEQYVMDTSFINTPFKRLKYLLKTYFTSL